MVHIMYIFGTQSYIYNFTTRYDMWYRLKICNMSQWSGKLRSFVSAFQQASGDASGGSFKSESPQRPMVGPNGGEDGCLGFLVAKRGRKDVNALSWRVSCVSDSPSQSCWPCITWPAIAKWCKMPKIRLLKTGNSLKIVPSVGAAGARDIRCHHQAWLPERMEARWVLWERE